MAIALLPYVFGGAGIAAISKRKQARKAQAAKNTFSQKYLLSEDISILENSISNAEKDLALMKAAKPKNAAQRRSQNFSVAALSSWIFALKEQQRDLKAEMAILKNSPSLANGSQVSNMLTSTSLPIQTPSQLATVTNATLEAGENLAAPTVKKGVNWLLIGGVLVGGYFLVKMLKK